MLTYSQLRQQNKVIDPNIRRLNNDVIQANQIVYKNFAVKHSDQFLGISIQNQKMYLVQKKTISVFQYYGLKSTGRSFSSLPTLVKQIFLPFQISKYIITQKYICIKSKTRTQIRDIQFQSVYFSQPTGLVSTKFDTASESGHTICQQLELDFEIVDDHMIIWKILLKKASNAPQSAYSRHYISQTYHILNKTKSIIHFRAQEINPMKKQKPGEICRSPIFINHIGYIQNFYIWQYSSTDVQMGIYFHKQTIQDNISENSLYQISNLHIGPNYAIKQLFYFDDKSYQKYKGKQEQQVSKQMSGPYMFFIILESTLQQSPKVHIRVYEVMPQQQLSPSSDQNQKLNNYLGQFKHLSGQTQYKQDYSSSSLLNQLLEENGIGNNKNKQPATLLQHVMLEGSKRYVKSFYNHQTKVLWVEDASANTYKIIFNSQIQQAYDQQKNKSILKNIQTYKNQRKDSQLQAIMYDIYPIYKQKAISLEIGIIDQTNRNHTQQEFDIRYDQKQVIQFNDNELQKIGKQNQQQKHEPDQQSNSQITQPNQQMIKQVNSQVVTQKQRSILNKDKNFQPQTQDKQYIDEYIQTQPTEQPQEMAEQLQEAVEQLQKVVELQEVVQLQGVVEQAQLTTQQISSLLQPLNFKQIQSQLISLNSFFLSNISKNMSKIKQTTIKSKQQIKKFMTTQIFGITNSVFNHVAIDLQKKIQTQVMRNREYVQKLFDRNIQHFNSLLMQDQIKQESIKKSILQNQLTSINDIKQASFHFLDVTKIREMHKIAYNQLITQNIHEVTQKIQSLQNRINQMIQSTQQGENKIFQHIKTLTQTINILLSQPESQSEKESIDKQPQKDSQIQDSQSEHDEEEIQDEQSDQQQDQYEQQKQIYDPRRIPTERQSFGADNFRNNSYHLPNTRINNNPMQAPYMYGHHPQTHQYSSNQYNSRPQFVPQNYSRFNPRYQEFDNFQGLQMNPNLMNPKLHGQAMMEMGPNMMNQNMVNQSMMNQNGNIMGNWISPYHQPYRNHPQQESFYPQYNPYKVEMPERIQRCVKKRFGLSKGRISFHRSVHIPRNCLPTNNYPKVNE